MDNGIPLSTVRSNVSTGARKATMPRSPSFDGQTEKEKAESSERRGRRRKLEEDRLGRSNTGGSDDEGAELNFMGRVYAQLIGFSVVTRYLVYIIPVTLMLAIPLIVLPLTGNGPNDRNTIPVGGTGGPSLFNLFLWIEITWLTLWAARLVAWVLPNVFLFFSGIVSVGTRKYATVIFNLNHPLSLFFWALATWVTFQNLFRAHNDENDTASASDGRAFKTWVRDLQRVLGSLFVASAVLLGEKAIVQLIGVSYHQRSFANRIKDSKAEIRLLGLLYDASRTLFPMYCREFEEEDYIINDSIDMMLRSKGKKGVANPIKVLGEVGRIGDKVTSVFGNIASEITGKQVFNPNSAHSIVLEALEKVTTSEALARRIWLSFVVEGRDSLVLEDVQEVMGPAYKKEAEEAFFAIDNDGNGDISLQEMIRKVVDIGTERKAIAEGMKDIGQALQALDRVLLFVVVLITVFIFLAFFESTFLNNLAAAGTALLSLSFVFAATTQEFLGSCIFLFVKHPYDVGDRVNITDVKMTVERISLLYSVFTRLDTAQIVQIPNIVLNNLWVDNISRSKAMTEGLSIDVSYDTTFEDIELLRLEIEAFVRHPDNARDFKPDFSISVGGVGNLDKMTLMFGIKHKSNWHNDSVRATRRSKFMCALAMALKKVPIYGPGGGGDALGGPSNPSYSVSVTDEFAAAKREESAKAKDAARLVPSQKDLTEDEQREAEQQAIAELNTRPVIPQNVSLWDSAPLSPDGSHDMHRTASSRHSLQKQLSQSGGRRRAGEGLPPSASSEMAAGVHAVSPNSPLLETFDEESRTDMPTSFYNVNRSASRGSQAPGGTTSGMLHPSQSTNSQGGRRHPQAPPSNDPSQQGPPGMPPAPGGPPPPSGRY
ncbi:Mechanosensitive ion channel-domain-containing protein [Stachybotrys elegans]|uniref:Mechanosensitive ion channel protein n=1 Tax=Stachybotrys elegans TaxID=80388 RepID=A0A8K0SVR8_9HYPO|nr:Mechanosensitive ion channel-domain-containing protein [Stachybotrys elegans]